MWLIYKDPKDVSDIKDGEAGSAGEWCFTGRRRTRSGGVQYQLRRLLWKFVDGVVTDEWKFDDTSVSSDGNCINNWASLAYCRKVGLDVPLLLAEWKRDVKDGIVTAKGRTTLQSSLPDRS